LRGVADQQACPECGLLAERSRRVTDELHDTRPRWLRSLSWGINLILLAMVVPLAGRFVTAFLLSFFPAWWEFYLDLIGFDLAAVLLLLGVILLTRPEGYAPADRTDRWLRVLPRIIVLVPLVMLVLVHVELESAVMLSGTLYLIENRLLNWSPLFIALSAFLPTLLFLHLRGLAKRARSAHLAEHCMIVGVGAFVSMLYISIVSIPLNNPNLWGLEYGWEFRSTASLLMMLLLGVASGLFIL
jgi:hypothetical protein